MKKDKIKFDLESFSIDDVLDAVKMRKKSNKRENLNKTNYSKNQGGKSNG
jgi:hypothetical protein